MQFWLTFILLSAGVKIKSYRAIYFCTFIDCSQDSIGLSWSQEVESMEVFKIYLLTQNENSKALPRNKSFCLIKPKFTSRVYYS